MTSETPDIKVDHEKDHSRRLTYRWNPVWENGVGKRRVRRLIIERAIAPLAAR